MIETKHRAPLDRAITTLCPNDKGLVYALYHEAQKVLDGNNKNDSTLPYLRTRLVGQNSTYVCVTCARTGLFVELTLNADKTPLLNFGKKAVVSLRDALNNEVTRNF